MNTAEFGSNPGNLVELGANWIHGASYKNSVFGIAERFNLLEKAPIVDK